ncbi:MAG: penicillin-binding protein [Bacteroidales bacterium]|jgi:cell division protein FtsI (penicillin-binding protein 3)
MDIRKDILWRVYLVYFGILLFGIAIVAKMVHIQLKEGEELAEKANTQELQVFDIEASRGNILASDGSLLATSVPIFEVRFDAGNPAISKATFNAKVDSIAQGLAIILNKSARIIKSDLIKAHKKGNRYMLISRKTTYDQLKQIRKLPIFREGRYRGGLITNQKTQRAHPFNELAARTIGYVIEEEDLFVGLEGSFSNYLTGKDGKQVMRRINHGDWIPIHDENEVEPVDGLDLVTTLDIQIQDVAEHALLETLTLNKAFQGCAVVMEVKTGKIRANANLRYDSSQASYKEIYNYSVGESIEPGSTFKLASILAALEDNKVKLTDSLVTGEGYTTYYNRGMQDVHKIGNGRITVREAFEFSSNVGISTIINNAYKTEPEKFINRLYSFNLNEPLNLEIHGEGKPNIKSPSNKQVWYGTSLPWMSIGYELTVTPLITLTLYNSIANDGVMVKPYFVTDIMQGGVSKKHFDPQVINQKVVSESTLLAAQSLLEGVIERGTGKSTFKNSPYKVAGKTGTAQIAMQGKYNKKNYNATFVGYFPAENPIYSIIVVVNNPSAGKYYGGSVAAPIFKEIADNLYATSISLELANSDKKDSIASAFVKRPLHFKDLATIYNSLNIPFVDGVGDEEWVVTSQKKGVTEFNAVNFSGKMVPNVKGMKAKDAVYLLENMGVSITVSGRGIVRSQSIASGSALKPNMHINLELSNI